MLCGFPRERAEPAQRARSVRPQAASQRLLPRFSFPVATLSKVPLVSNKAVKEESREKLLGLQKRR